MKLFWFCVLTHFKKQEMQSYVQVLFCKLLTLTCFTYRQKPKVWDRSENRVFFLKNTCSEMHLFGTQSLSLYG